MKSFVLYGGAFSYQNVGVEFRMGSRAVLTIYHDGAEHEQIELQEIKTEVEIHRMMLDKGFLPKSEEEVAMIREVGGAAQKEDRNKRDKRFEKEKQRYERIMKNRAKGVDMATADGGEPNTLPEEENPSPEQIKQWKIMQWKMRKRENPIMKGDEL